LPRLPKVGQLPQDEELLKTILSVAPERKK